MHPHDKAAIEKAREDLYVKRAYDPPQSGYEAYEKRFEELVDLRLHDLRKRRDVADTMDAAMAEQLGKEIDAVKSIAAPLWNNRRKEREDKYLHRLLND